MNDEHDTEKFEEKLRGYLDRFTTFPRRDPAMLPARPRRVSIAFASVAALVIVCVATTATALVITLRGSSSTLTASSAGTAGVAGVPGHLFFPIGNQSSGSSGTTPANGAAVSTAPAPLSADNALVAPGATRFANPSGASPLFPNDNGCGGGGSGRVNGGQVEAVGVAAVAGLSPASTEQLSIQIAGAGAANVAAVNDAQGKEAAVVAALQRSGVTTADITAGPVQLGYLYYDAGQRSGQATASATITVRASTVQMLASAADVAKSAGAASEYTEQGVDVATPSEGALAQAISDATDAAHATAMATASAAGVRLGKVAGVTSSPPSLCYGAGGEQLVVAVVVDYSIA